MNKNFVVGLFVLSNVFASGAMALDQPPAQILNGGGVALDQVELVERFTPATGDMLAQHTVDVVVSGTFQAVCSGLEALVKIENVDSRTNVFSYQVIGAVAPIRCMAIGRPVRKTFLLDEISLSPNEQLPSVVVNGIRGVRGQAE
jgi:hypothetical protein